MQIDTQNREYLEMMSGSFNVSHKRGIKAKEML